MSLSEKARGILAQHGVDIDNLPPPEPFDPIAALTENAHTALEVLPSRLRHVQPRNPEVRAWVHQFLADPASVWTLILTGPVGRGKTCEAIGALRGCLLGSASRGRRMTWQYTSHTNLNAALRPSPNDEHLEALEQACRVDLLVIDDMGAGQYTDWAADSLYRIVDTRWANERPMIVTSNLLGEELADLVGARIASRLSGGTQIALDGKFDLRRMGAA
jgi:DNA replication protein DnaC